MLEIGKSNDVRFKVNVNGTSAMPEVKFILEAPQAEMGFSANMGDGYWFTSVAIPEDFRPGDYGFRIEVLVNKRLFTPIRKTVTVASNETIAAPAVTPERPPVPTPATPTQTPEQTKEWENEGGALPARKEIPIPKPPEKVAAPSFFKKVVSVTEAKKPAPKKPVAKLNIAEIVAESNKRFDKVLAESPSYTKPGKKVQPMNLKTGTPITLKKGEIVYE